MSLRARTSIVSLATLGSRMLGFVRDAATAAVLGVGPVADALAAALTLPLLARRLLAEGALNLAFIPALAREMDTNGAVGASQLARATLVLLVGVLLVVSTLGAIFMPTLIGLLAPGFSPEGTRAELAIWCGRIAVFYLPLAGLSAIYGGIANGAQRVLLPALAPVAANITVLAVIAILVWRGMMASDQAALAIAGATVAAGISQLVLMLRAASGCPVSPTHKLRGGGEGTFTSLVVWRKAAGVLRNALPALLFAGLSQFRFIIIAALVSATDGAFAALNYAQRLMDLPLGLVGASAGAVLLPLLVQGGRESRDEAGRAVLAALAFALPAAIGLFILADPVVRVLFQRGSFDVQDVQVTAAMLSVLALSLPFQGLERVLSAMAAAAGMMRVAEKIALGSLVLCLLSGLMLGWLGSPHGFSGVALVAGAAALSAIVSVVGMLIVLVRAGHLELDMQTVRMAAGLFICGLLMGLSVWGIEVQTRDLVPVDGAGWARAVRLVGLVMSGMLIYGLGALALFRLLRHRAQLEH